VDVEEMDEIAVDSAVDVVEDVIGKRTYGHP